MTRCEHTQIGHVIIWSLLIVAVVFAANANFGSLAYRTTLLLACVVLLILLALFCKLTIKIDDQTLRWSFGIQIIRKQVPSLRSPHVRQSGFAGGTAGEFI